MEEREQIHDFETIVNQSVSPHSIVKSDCLYGILFLPIFMTEDD